MESELNLVANAKINLGLQVLGKMPSGYHLIRSIVLPITLGDEISFCKKESGEVELDVSFSPKLKAHLASTAWGREQIENLSLDSNLVLKAAKLLFAAAKLPQSPSLRISLRKNIPLAAGLGGGSADAAAVIVGLNKFLSLGLSKQELLSVGAEVGSDVCALMFDVPVLMYGRGEHCIEIKDFSSSLLGRCLSNLQMVIIKPTENVSTALAYQGLGFSADTASSRVNHPWQDEEAILQLRNMGLKFAFEQGFPSLIAEKEDKLVLENAIIEKTLGSLTNDFEQSVFREYPQVLSARNLMLELGAVKSLMSGSGSAMIGFFHKQQSANLYETIASKLPKDWFLYLAS